MVNKRTRAAQPGATATVTARKRYVALGMIQSRAPRVALLRALRELRPQWDVRLQPQAATGRYRVEVRADSADASPPGSKGAASIDPWLRIKSALIAAFPADKPNAVTAWDP